MNYPIQKSFIVLNIKLNLYMLITCSRMLQVKNKATQLLMIKDFRPSKHYLPWDIMIFRRRS
jgi:hypothetical protein